ncbi:MAG: iron-sulfur cluster assembly protein [Alphaproteobacteria bacterium]|nr:iron-sulfur cluster assembly protein [Alphaproteobacteria bacterium]
MSEYDPGLNPYGSFMMDPAVPEGTTARAGAKLEAGAVRADDEAIVEAMRTVHDPEIPVNIYDLGLIYETERLSDGDVKVLMTLTAPACPVAGEMPYDVAAAVSGVEGVGEVEVMLTWEPAWTPDRMSDDAKLILNMF